MAEPMHINEDRSLVVPPGATVRAGYVHRDAVRIACLDRMAVGDVDAAMRRRMGCAPAQPWPCATGQWEGERFAIHDGRHDFIAALMLGVEWVLVAWIEPAPA